MAPSLYRGFIWGFLVSFECAYAIEAYCHGSIIKKDLYW